MAKETRAARRQTGDEFLRSLFPEEAKEHKCPQCKAEVQLTRDRVIDCIIDHPAVIVRETQFWRCPLCNEVAGQESLDLVEPIEYISSSG